MACNDRQLTQAQREAGYDQQRTGVVQAVRPFSGSPTIENLIDYINRELGPALRAARNKVNDVYLQVKDQAPSANPLSYYFAVDTGAADPTAGRIRLNASPQNTATIIRVSQSNARLQDVTPWLDVMAGGVTAPIGVVTLYDAINPTRFLRFDLNTMTDQGAYWDLGVTIVESSHTDPFVEDEAMVVSFIAGVSAAGSTVPVGALSPIAGMSILANPTAVPAPPSALTATRGLQIPRTNAPFTAIEWVDASQFQTPPGRTIAGRRGMPGPGGLTGATGLTGAAGAPGLRALPGLRGMPGAAGLRGAAGTDGALGRRGTRGRKGLPGPPGQPGLLLGQQLFLRDDFTGGFPDSAGGIGETGWAIETTVDVGASVQPCNSDNGHPGCYLMTGAPGSTTAICTITRQRNGGTDVSCVALNDFDIFEAVIKTGPSVAAQLISVGLTDNPVASGIKGTNEFAGATYDSATTNWMLSLRNGGTLSSTDTGIAVQAGAWYLLRVWKRGTTWYFQLGAAGDLSAISSQSTNAPAGVLWPTFALAKKTSIGAHSMTVDYFSMAGMTYGSSVAQRYA